MIIKILAVVMPRLEIRSGAPEPGAVSADRGHRVRRPERGHRTRTRPDHLCESIAVTDAVIPLLEL